MTSRTAQTLSAVTLYALLALLPLAAAAAGHTPPSRGFWVEFGCALGFVGLSMMGLQFILTARFRTIAEPFGQDIMLRFHREAGIAAALFVLAHPVICCIAHPPYLEFFDPRVNLPRAAALTTVTLLIPALVLLPLLRKTLRIPYEWWRITHGIIAFLVVAIGLAHTLMVDHYVSILWKQALWILMTGAAMGLLLHVRVVKPLAMRKRPYRVADVRRETGTVWTLTLEPDSHPGFTFKPGQFVGLTLGDSPFSIQQHPFTIASSAAHPERIELTIKELGDFTAAIKDVAPGSRAFLEGPYGSFTLDRADADPIVLIVGGIGITPAMSMIRTIRDTNDTRHALLLYFTATLDRAPFRDELLRLENEINLRYAHVPEHPPENWPGDRGFPTPELLHRHIDDDTRARAHFYVCGPPPMMDLVERLLLDMNIHHSRIHSERFDIA